MAFFDDIRLPIDVERGASGGPGFNTTIRALISGFEKRNKNWSVTRGRWDIGYGIITKPSLDGVINTFYAVNGMADGFRFKDWSDFQIGDTITPDITTRQLIGTTDGSTAIYQIFKKYTRGSTSFDRNITKVVAGTARTWVNNIEITEGAGAGEFTIDNNTGLVTLGSTLAAQSGTEVEELCEFDVPVRFNQDQLEINVEGIFSKDSVISIPSIDIIEIRI